MTEASEQLWIYPNGMGADGRPLFEPQSTEDLARLATGNTREARHAHAASLQELQWRHKTRGEAHYGVKQGIDPGKLEQTGWGAILPATKAGSPEAAAQHEILEALRPLLDWRREQATRNHETYFQIFQGPRGYFPGETKQKYLARLGTGPGPADPDGGVPYYLLIIGSPQVIPYHVQYQLDVQYAVGRIHFDAVQDYASYARSVVAAERGGLRLARDVAFLGVANPDDPATQLSRKLMVGPLADRIETGRAGQGWKVQRHFDGDATRQTLERLLGGGGAAPALLYTGSHGMGFPLDDPRQRRHQGALLCQDWPGPRAWKQPIREDFYFCADHVRSDADLLGMIAFNFACFGGGTPEHDEFSKQAFTERKAIAPEAFVSGLHKKLLGLPRGGALACVGHVERAWGSSFLWETGKRGAPEPQLAVFESTLGALLEGLPVGAAMDYFNQRYAELSSDLASYLETLEYTDGPDPYVLADAWTSHNDARGYAITGDPAVRLQVGGADDTRARDAIDVRSFGPDPASPPAATASPPTAAASPPAAAASPPAVATLPAPLRRDPPALPQYGLLGGTSSPDDGTPGLLARLGHKVADVLGNVLGDAAVLEVRTFTSQDLQAVAGAESLPASGARLRAYTRCGLDGDTTACVPVTADGALDERLWALHVGMVEQAQAHRRELIGLVLSLFSHDKA
jgi:hypothetical protein